MCIERTSPGPIDHRPTYLSIDLDAIAFNYRQVRRCIDNKLLMAVVKANAYGHGLVEVARFLEDLGVDAFGVAFVEEGVLLREAGIKVPILVFGGVLEFQIETYIKHRLEITASSISKLESIDRVAKSLGTKARVHLKLDSGMERIGVHTYNSESFLSRSLQMRNCEVVGIYSHFALAEEEDFGPTQGQLERFRASVDGYGQQLKPRPLLHIANSAAMMRSSETHLDMVRVGLALYGIHPEPWMQGLMELRPAMSLISRVVYFKVVHKGAGISYGHKYIAPRDTRVATVQIGYGDGFFRSLSNRGEVIIRGVRYPIVGSICMDQLMVDLGPEGTAYPGDEVVLIGGQGSESIDVHMVAQLAQTVPHEVLTTTNLRVARRYVRQG